MPLIVTDTYVLPAGQSILFDRQLNEQNYAIELLAYNTHGIDGPLQSEFDFTNYGRISSTEHLDYVSSFGVFGALIDEESSWERNTFQNSGEISALSDYGQARTVQGMYTPTIENTGSILAESRDQAAWGIITGNAREFFNSYIQNQGLIQAKGVTARGVEATYAEVINSGVITATGSAEESYGVHTTGANILNSGSITASVTTGVQEGLGVWIGPIGLTSARDGGFVDNTGTISGDGSIVDWPGAEAASVVRNGGTLNGRVDLGGGADLVINPGIVNGAVLLGSGDDGYDGRGGHASDRIDGGAGADTLIGGSAGDQLLGGDGNDLLIATSGTTTLQGSEGADIFTILSTASGATVADFVTGVDVLDLPGAQGAPSVVGGNGHYDVTYQGPTEMLTVHVPARSPCRT